MSDIYDLFENGIMRMNGLVTVAKSQENPQLQREYNHFFFFFGFSL
jgi:hypothetical protein